MNEAEYKRLKRKIQGEYDERVKALDMIWELSGGSSRKPSLNGRGETSGKATLLQAVKDAVAKLDGEFTAKDVEAQIKQDNPTVVENVKRASISSTLNRLASMPNEVKEVLKGKGKRPTTYRR